MSEAKSEVKKGGKPKVGAHTKLPPKIIKCGCVSESQSAKYQDEKYGKGQRACNPGGNGYRCTICAKVHSY